MGHRRAETGGDDPVVATSSGRVRGRARHGIHSFLGIPYAAAPTGERYLAAPAPVEPWTGVRDATSFGPSPPQTSVAWSPLRPSAAGGDEYLNVNVFTPELGDEALPVLVWFCVGGFVVGSNAWPIVDGSRFARDGIVVVTVNFRLGAEGFLLLDDAPANRAVLDWLSALHWVQDEIAAFGGDPGNVTIAGHSAGGATCLTLATVPRARGLFRRAIPMSGPPFAGDPDRAAQHSRAFVASLGVGATRRELAAVGSERLLRAQAAVLDEMDACPDPARLLHAVGGEGPPFRPVIDGELVVGDPDDLVRDGTGSGIDVLTGATVGEFNTRFAYLGDGIDSDGAHDAMRAFGLSAGQADAFHRRYAHLAPAALLGQVLTDTLFRAWPARFAEARAAGPGRTYLYEFAWPSPEAGGEAAHGVEIPFAWDNLDAPGASAVVGSGAPQELADTMHAAWVRFVTDGDPGWPAYDAPGRPTMVFDAASGIEHGRTDRLAAPHRRTRPGAPGPSHTDIF